MPNGTQDISFDESFMWYYDEEDQYQTPEDPRDEEGYDARHYYETIGKYSSPAFCKRQIYRFSFSHGLKNLKKVQTGWSEWDIEYNDGGLVVGCTPPPKSDFGFIGVILIGYIGYRIIT